ncbi:MAG: aminoglycoside phosphotransferase family protein [Bacilli bacterium]|nr:aminoglycoside phosphotransferase family protein [Bacilli bacterium]
MDANVISTCFLPNDRTEEIIPYGSGHINKTYTVKSQRGKFFLLQQINHKIFTDVESLMNNINLVTSYIKHYYPEKTTLDVIKTTTNKLYASTNDGYYRAYEFIGNSTSIDIVTDANDMYICGKGFGEFLLMLADFNAATLKETIPNFHNTESRYKDFMLAAVEDKMGRYKTCVDEVNFVTDRKPYTSRITSLLRSGEMPLRVTHNDTKINNILLNKDDHSILAVIDLDTVMPGSVCYDFGDSIRAGCNSAAEDEGDMDKVHFMLDYFKAYARGYLEMTKDKLSQSEKDNLAFSGILMTYECGMRFLMDYLNGDTYFHTTRPGQNLDRARNQFKLVSDMEKLLPEMEEYIRTLCK